MSQDSKLVVIDDGSKDNTYNVLCNLSKDLPLLEPLYKLNEVHGPTVIYGYKYAIEHGADYTFQTDSDSQTNLAKFDVFLETQE